MTALTLAQIQALAAQAATTGINMNETVEGGGRKLIPAGRYLGRVVSVVDLGTQPQEFNGKATTPADEIELTLALWGYYVNAEGQNESLHDAATNAPYLYTPYSLKISQNPKATAIAAFAAMNYAKDPNVRNFLQFIGKAFLFDITVKKSAKGKERNEVRWAMTAGPFDPVSKKPYDVAELHDSMYSYFSWTHPTIESWNALHIPGEWEAKDGKPAQSKNRVQQTIVGALNFEGSPLHRLLIQAGAPIPEAIKRDASESDTTGPAPSAAAQAALGIAGATPSVAQPAPIAAPAAVAVVAAPVVAPAAAPVAAPVTAPVAPTAVVAAPLAPATPAAPSAVVAPTGPEASAQPATQSPSDVAAPAVNPKLLALLQAGIPVEQAQALIASGAV